MDKAHFAMQLREAFPARSDLAYVKSLAEIPHNTSVVFNVHLADLGFDADTSTKPFPFKHSAELLVDHILTEKFLTEGR